MLFGDNIYRFVCSCCYSLSIPEIRKWGFQEKMNVFAVENDTAYLIRS